MQAVPPALSFDGTQIDWTQGAPADFKQAMDDDFNTAGAVSVLFELASCANRDQDRQASALMRVLGEMIGLLQQVPSEYFKAATRYTKRALEAAAKAQEQQGEHETVVEPVVVLDDEAVKGLIAERKAAKAARDFATSDRIRDQLAAQGVLLDDKPGGLTEWRRG
jgi:Cysteinyl-tRNA synthetase